MFLHNILLFFEIKKGILLYLKSLGYLQKYLQSLFLVQSSTEGARAEQSEVSSQKFFRLLHKVYCFINEFSFLVT